ncbi:Rrf2 family transcriptional regulator [bacterium]|nr:Rrf2 family transcriptional regulator [bacterium]
MKISTKVRYAARAIVELAKSNSKKPVAIQWIASQQEISPSYLEQLLAKMRYAGIVRSFKGPGGGYVLARPPEEISLHDVFLALEGEMAIIKCLLPDEKNCDRIEYCIMRVFWEKFQDSMVENLKNINFADIIGEEKKLLKRLGYPKPRKLKRKKK